MDPQLISFFFFNFVSSPPSHLSSLLCALPHVSELTQLLPQKWKNSPTSQQQTKNRKNGFSRLVTKNKNKKQKPKPIDKEGEIQIRTWILECWVSSESSSISGWIFEHRPMTVKLSRAVDALRCRWRFWSAEVWSDEKQQRDIIWFLSRLKN